MNMILLQNNKKIIINANSIFRTSGVALNNKLYFSSNDSNVYEYDTSTGQQKIIQNLDKIRTFD